MRIPFLLSIFLAVLVAALSGGAAKAQFSSCPPVGTQFILDNANIRVTVTSISPTPVEKSCAFRQNDDGTVHWKRYMSSLTPAGPAARAAVPAAEAFGPLQGGVYACDMPISIGGMMQGTPATGPMFGVTGPGRYRDFNGGTGTFALNGNILTMTTGPLKGTRYRREGATYFKPMNARGETGSIRCILNRYKSLNGRW